MTFECRAPLVCRELLIENSEAKSAPCKISPSGSHCPEVLGVGWGGVGARGRGEGHRGLEGELALSPIIDHIINRIKSLGRNFQSCVNAPNHSQSRNIDSLSPAPKSYDVPILCEFLIQLAPMSDL